ncbi:glycosyltransferase family 2 protein [Desulfoplanes sp.]
MVYSVSIIIPVFNQWNLTRDCLVSLHKTISREDVQVIVVDNGSSDATPGKCPTVGKCLFKENFLYIRNEVNRNFGPACNQGARKASGAYLFFLNNDTVAQNDWLPPLLETMEKNSQIGAVGPLLLFSGAQRVQHLGVSIVPGGNVTHIYEYFPKNHPVVSKKRDLLAITGAALFISKILFKECEGFFEGYKNGFEDLDLCLQILRRGKKIQCVQKSCFVHLTSQTFGRFDHDLENSALIMKRYPEWVYPDFHTHAKQDGFEVRLTSWQEICLGLPSFKESEVEQQSVDLCISALGGLLERNPLWENGYEKLAMILENEGEMDSALYYRTLRARICPSEKAFFLVQKFAKRVGNEKLFLETKGFINKVVIKSKDDTKKIERAKKIMQWAEKSKEHEIASLYKGWLL